MHGGILTCGIMLVSHGDHGDLGDHGDHGDHCDHCDRYRAVGADCRKGRVITNQTPLVAIDGLQGVILMHLHITSS